MKKRVTGMILAACVLASMSSSSYIYAEELTAESTETTDELIEDSSETTDELTEEITEVK